MLIRGLENLVVTRPVSCDGQDPSPSQDTHTHNLEIDSDGGGQLCKQIRCIK